MFDVLVAVLPSYTKPDKHKRPSSVVGVPSQTSNSSLAPPAADRSGPKLLLHGGIEIDSLPPISAAEQTNLDAWRHIVIPRQQAEEILQLYK
jgi:hypothetical protein